MRRNLLTVFFIVFFFNLMFGQTAVLPSAGDGTESNPYQIATLDNLYWLSQNESEWNNYFIQTTDIDATATDTWLTGDHDNDELTPDEAMGFLPIGRYINYVQVPFTGTYNGNEHTIDGLYINRPSENTAGLFGIANGAVIIKLGLNNVNVTGDYDTGGLVGLVVNGSVVSESYSKGNVEGFYAGVLIGELNYSTVANCYVLGTIQGTYSEGLIGDGMVGEVINSHSVVSAVEDCCHPYFDGNNSSYQSSFYNADSAQNTTLYSQAKVTYDMKQICTYLETGWDFGNETANGNENIWGLNPNENNGYPFLLWEGYTNTGSFNKCCYYPAFEIEGSGTVGDPYLVENICHLKWLSENDSVWDKYFIQIADINVKDSYNWNYGDHDGDSNTKFAPMGFSPLGYYLPNTNEKIEFSGTYDGQNHVIDSLYICRPKKTKVAFFGVTENANISNLGIVNAEITGEAISGIFAAEIQATTIDKCYSSGNITGGGYTGGYVGGFVAHVLWDSYISRSYSDCNVSSDYNDIGGFVGNNYMGSITQSYSLGNVTGEYRVGGFAGNNFEDIYDSYSRAVVNSDNGGAVGGFVGMGTGGNIKRCYSTGYVNYNGSFSSYDGFVGARTEVAIYADMFDIETSGVNNGIGGYPYSTQKMKNLCSYLDYDWDFIAETNNGTNDYWGMNADENDGYPFLSWQGLTHTANCSGTEIHQLKNNNALRIFPNPTNGPVVLYSESKSVIELINTEGKVCKKLIVEKGENKIDFSNFEKGMYLLKSVSKNGIEVSKIILN